MQQRGRHRVLVKAKACVREEGGGGHQEKVQNGVAAAKRKARRECGDDDGEGSEFEGGTLSSRLQCVRFVAAAAAAAAGQKTIRHATFSGLGTCTCCFHSSACRKVCS